MIAMTKDDNDIIRQRRAQLQALRERGNAYPNDFRRNILAQELHTRYGDEDKEQLETETEKFSLAGRMMSRRVMGKASFAHIQDMSGRIQLFVRRDDLADDTYAQFKKWDIGDLVGVDGERFQDKDR